MRPTVMRRRRHYISEVPSLNVRTLNAKALTFIKGTYQVDVEIARLRFCITVNRYNLPRGGRWYTFRCPLCKKGRFKLYLFKCCLGCHKSHHLAYWSENRGKADRAINMKWKYVHQISKDDNNASLRPSDMHRKTYERIMNKATWYDRRAWARFYGW